MPLPPRRRQSRDSSDDDSAPGGGGAKNKRKRKRGGGGGDDNKKEAAAPVHLKAEQVLPRIVEAAKESDGSRWLTARIADAEACDDAERDKIYQAVLPESLKLASDLYGSNVMQKLFDRATEEQLKAMAQKLKGEIFNLSTHRYGCRVVQKLVELLPEEPQVALGSELRNRVVECVENMHGNHVVQMLVRKLPTTQFVFVLDAMVAAVDKMSSHMYGCRVIQRLLERCEHDQIRGLLAHVMANVAKLTKDKHGNYIVQCVLEHGPQEEKRKIMQVVREGFVEYARDKVSSNVVEKCFEVSTVGIDVDFLKESREALYRTVLGEDGDDAASSPLQQLYHDRFGNYTVQCVIKHSRGEDREALEKRIMASEAQLKESATGRHVIAALKKATGHAPDEDEDQAEAGQANSSTTPDAPSRGSLLHASGQCKPCAWFWKAQGCRNDQNCQHCHLCPEGELKDRKKGKRNRGDEKP